MDREKVEHRELAGREVNGALPLLGTVIEQEKKRKRKAKKPESLSYFSCIGVGHNLICRRGLNSSVLRPAVYFEVYILT